MKKVIISAFAPFGNHTTNYSALVAEQIQSATFETTKVLLDVVYDDCYTELSKQNLQQFDLIIALGEARMRNNLTVETYAKNVSSCSLADNNGVTLCNHLIDVNAPDLLQCQLPLEQIAHIAQISGDAGKFVCNNLYFHLLKNHPTKSLFVHVPDCKDDASNYAKHAQAIVEIIDMLLGNKPSPLDYSTLTPAKLTDMGICPTCFNKQHNNSLFGDNSHQVIFEDDLFEAFLVGNPRADGHAAISTKTHYKDIMQAPADVVAKIMTLAQKCMIAIKQVYNAESVYLCTMCDGPMNHFHVQLIPRYSTEKRGSTNFVKPRIDYTHDQQKVDKLRSLLK